MSHHPNILFQCKSTEDQNFVQMGTEEDFNKMIEVDRVVFPEELTWLKLHEQSGRFVECESDEPPKRLLDLIAASQAATGYLSHRMGQVIEWRPGGKTTMVTC